MITELELLYAAIAMRDNNDIIDAAFNILKQFSKNENIYLYDNDGNTFKITKDTKFCTLQKCEE